MPGGWLTFLESDDADVPTPGLGKVSLFVDNADGFPAVKDDAGSITSLAPVAGPGVPGGGTAGQVLEKIDGVDYNTQWATPSSGFANPMTTLGDIIAGSTAGAPIRLGIGSSTQVLTVVSGVPAWAAATGGVSDGDKGDITVSGSGAVWTIDINVVTYAKMQDVSDTKKFLGRNTAGAGDIEEVTITQALDWAGTAAQGDLLYRNASAWVFLPAGTSGHFLQTQGAGANPQWAASGGGGVTGFTSALNTASPNSTINVSSLAASGGTTSQHAALVPKGSSGGISVSIPDGTSVGGNALGARALNLQISRSAASQTASGTDSILIGGADNTNVAQYAAILGGTGSSIDSGGTGSVVLGGSGSAIGNITNSIAHGAGVANRGVNNVKIHGSNADTQSTDYIFRFRTTSATPAAVTGNGSSAAADNQVILINASSCTLRYLANAFQTATGDSKAFTGEVLMTRGANAAATTIAIIGSQATAVLGAGSGTWTLVPTADTINGGISFIATGEAAKNIRWSIKVIDVQTTN